MNATTTASPRYYELRAGGALIALEASHGDRPIVLYAGRDLPNVSSQELALLSTQQHAPGSAAVPLRGSFLNEVGTGISGPSGLTAHRSGKDWAIDLRVARVDQASASQIAVHCIDRHAGIAARHILKLDAATGMLVCSTSIENTRAGDVAMDWCAALCLPIDPRLTRFLSFTGKWAHEFAIEEVPEFKGSIVRENASGRTSHHVFPGGIMATPQTGENAGMAIGFHLAWSGNHRLRIDRHNDGRSIVQMGEMLLPGEICLSEGESYQTPDFLACWSDAGLNPVSHAFHDYLTTAVMDKRTQPKPRPVHYNTWEAVYFNHDEAALLDLAQAAADVGAERFVLDDGWFGSRRHDGAGLGDWWVTPELYPDGLHPLANKVRELGMEFGLWFEPEMVNPDSDLYRAHPDWVLGLEGVDTVPFRGQLTLDLTKAEVCAYLFDRISELVSTYRIAYIKWDMNRDTPHPGSEGRAVMHRQTGAVYNLMKKLRAAHPQLEIESCSSGGARADFGILRHTDRIWTSDNNDARQRQHIMRGASHFFPLSVLGNHVGPRTCHITGRKFGMAFRVGSAMLGHMGMELNLRAERESDLAILKSGIALHKKHRDLIHKGRFNRLESAEATNLVGCIAADQREGLFSYTMLDTSLDTLPRRIQFRGLLPDMDYRVRLIWPLHNPSISTPSIIDETDLMGDGHIFSGAALMGHGMQPPLTFPDTCLIYHLEACE
ncbi:alpha-galactosidase [Erythrobacter insulae]|uniref:alpha-galactosidase n=1 Tax=Erythrobacter insulae TaxID=2584124 RepID=A0A547PD57_9SPHN|nr:alpha-galactosidase [Erythrobacter insulae]TRD12068.1 alpha-galactosidase [Erythrobacter insulae]